MSWDDECAAAYDGLTPGDRQSILDAVLDGGKLGEVARGHGVELAAVCGVVDRNIVRRSWLGSIEVSSAEVQT
jgi:hypothetical protein